MSKLSIGLVSSLSEESKQLIELLESEGVDVLYHINPSEIETIHIENEALNVWLLSVDDDHWHDNIDQLLDGSDASIYFNEPGTLSKQSHPQYWSQKLVSRLYELSGLTEDKNKQTSYSVEEDNSQNKVVQKEKIESTAIEKDESANDGNSYSLETPSTINGSETDLNLALDVLETNSISLSSDVAAELVTELESISPELNSSIEESTLLEANLSFDENISLDDNVLVNDVGFDNLVPDNNEMVHCEELSLYELDEILLDETVVEPPVFEEIISADESMTKQTIETNEDDLNHAKEDNNETLASINDSTQNLLDLDVSEIKDVNLNLDDLDTGGLNALELGERLQSEHQIVETEEDVFPTEVEAENITEIELDDVKIGFEEPNSSFPKGNFDTIDFSNTLVPMLESAREINQEPLESHYSVDGEDSELSSDEVALASEKEYQESLLENEQAHQDLMDNAEEFDNSLAMETMSNVKTLAELEEQEELKEKQIQDEENKSIELESMLGELAFDGEEAEQEDFGKADFLSEEGELPVDEKVSITNENIEGSDEILGLSLESIEEVKITGKAVFYEEEVEVEEEKISILDESIEEAGLSLEGIAGEKITGRAVFIDEEETSSDEVSEDTVKESSLISSDDFDDGGLTLEFDSNKDIKTSGMAEFVIDDEPLGSELLEEDENSSLVDEGHIQVEGLEGVGNSFNHAVDELLKDEQEYSLIDENIPESKHGSELLNQENSNNSDEHPEQADFLLDELEFDIALESITVKSETETETETETEINNEIITHDLMEQPVEDEIPFLNAETNIENTLGDNQENEVKEGLISETFEFSEEPIEFEIPMLEEAATGLDFEEQEVTSLSNNLTPCWIIGASLGGPAALKQFLQFLPQDVNASFVIAQHIDESFLPVLADILTTNSHFEVTVANGSCEMSPGTIYLAPLKGKLIFLQDGSMLVDHSQTWTKPYSPCINDVFESAASIYGEQCGVIVLSGMGDDGLNGAEKVRSQGGTVWAQSTETCANSSMPEAVINANISSVVETPENLAKLLVNKVQQS